MDSSNKPDLRVTEIPSEIIAQLTDEEWDVVGEQLAELDARYRAEHPYDLDSEPIPDLDRVLDSRLERATRVEVPAPHPKKQTLAA